MQRSQRWGFIDIWKYKLIFFCKNLLSFLNDKPSKPIQWASIKLYEFGPSIEDYNFHFCRVLGAVEKFCYQKLKSVGVDVLPSTSGFYLFPNFELCRKKLEKKNIKNGQDFCDLLFEEKRVAVNQRKSFFILPKFLADARWSFIFAPYRRIFNAPLLRGF